MDDSLDAGPGFTALLRRVETLEGQVGVLEGRLGALQAEAQARPLPPPPRRPIEQTNALLPAMSPVAAVPEKTDPMVGTEPVLKWAGSVLVFLAGVFFVSTAISRGWIGPGLQLAGAVAGGLALLWWSLRMRARRPTWTLALAHTGIGVLAVSAAAGNLGLDLYGVGVALGATAVVAATAATMARATGRASIAATGVIAAVLNPLAIEATESYPWWAAGVWLAAIVLLSTGLGVRQRWASLRLIVFAVTAIPLLALAGSVESSGTTADLVVGLIVAAISVATFVSGPIAAHSVESETDPLVRSLDQRLIVSIPPFAWLLFGLMTVGGSNRPYLLAFGVAAISVAVVELLRRVTPMPRSMYVAGLVGSSIVATIGLIGLIDGPTLLIAVAAQAIGLGVLAWSFDDLLLKLNAAVLAVVAVVWTALELTIAIVDGGAGIGQHLANLFVVAAVVLLAIVGRRQSWFGPVALVAYSGWLFWVLALFADLEQGQVAVSIVWALSGGLVLLAGLGRDRRIAQIGLATLGITVVKLVTVDLEAVDTIWRAGLFFVVGLGLLRLGLKVGTTDSDTDDQIDSQIDEVLLG